MVVRTRTNTVPLPLVGKSWRGSTAQPDLLSTRKLDYIQDHVLPGNGHPLLIHHYELIQPGDYPRCNGQFMNGGAISSFVDFPVNFPRRVEWNLSHATISGPIPSAMQAATEWAAETNPSRPHVDVPVAILELRNMKDLFIKRVGNIGRDISSGRLALEYGYKPLISDLIKLTSLGKAYEARIRELTHLRRSGLRRKRIVWSDTGIKSELNRNIGLNVGLSVKGDIFTSTAMKCTVAGKWVYDPLPGIPGVNTGRSIHDTAAAAVLGWTPTIIDGSTLWEIMGFSWYFDWWSNTGDFIAARRNTAMAKPEKILVMYHTKTEQKIEWFSGGGIGFDAVTWDTRKPIIKHYITKTRATATVGFQAHLPILSERQITILADIMRGFK